LMIWATPPLPLPARAVPGHLMVELLPSVHALAAAFSRYKEKFCVVPDESERTAMVIGVLGRLTPELSAAIAELFQDVILPLKISARTVASSFRLLTPDRLYETVIGPRKTGKYSTVLPLKFAVSAAGIGESEPAKLTTPEARSVRPLPEPPPP
jgi:hypothetical protein